MTTTMQLVGQEPRREEFARVFNRLAVALREKDVDAATLQVYFDALKDLSFDAIDAGAQALTKEAGRRFFPTTAEWRQAAEIAQQAQLRQVVQSDRTEPWKHDCLECEDTGWVKGLTCDGAAQGACGRPKKHAPHDYTKACLCRATNRTYLRHQKFGAGA